MIVETEKKQQELARIAKDSENKVCLALMQIVRFLTGGSVL